MSCVGEMHLTCCGLTQYRESFICIFWPFYSAVICISAETYPDVDVVLSKSSLIVSLSIKTEYLSLIAVAWLVLSLRASESWQCVFRLSMSVVPFWSQECVEGTSLHPGQTISQKTHFEPERKKVPHKSLIGWNDDASLRCDKNTHNRQTVRTLSQIMNKCHLNNVVIVKIFRAVGLMMSVKHPCLIMCNSSIFEPVSTAGSLCLCWTVFWFEFLVL